LSIASAVNASGVRVDPASGPAQPLSGVDQRTLAASFIECRGITRERARNFYYGLRLTPEPRRSALYAIYAWMRAADDAADGEAGGDLAEQRRALAAFRETTERVLRGELPTGTAAGFWPAFAATVARYGIDHGIFEDVFRGLEEDMDHRGYATDADLSRYCYRVASTVGLACLAVWGLRPGVDEAVARDLAVRRGQAFQRTNILRDFAQDYDSRPRRVYLPMDAFARHGISPEDLREWRNPEACRRLVAEQAAIAREHYRASAPLDEMIDPACRPTLWAMTRIYSGLLAVIEGNPARIVARRRIRLPSTRKALIALRAAIAGRRASAEAEAANARSSGRDGW
jgi:phytoene synthase